MIKHFFDKATILAEAADVEDVQDASPMLYLEEVKTLIKEIVIHLIVEDTKLSTEQKVNKILYLETLDK